MLKCPHCNGSFPVWKNFFYTVKSEFVCKKCGKVSVIKRNWVIHWILYIWSVTALLWFRYTKYSILSIVFILISLPVILFLNKFVDKLIK